MGLASALPNAARKGKGAALTAVSQDPTVSYSRHWHHPAHISQKRDENTACHKAEGSGQLPFFMPASLTNQAGPEESPARLCIWAETAQLLKSAHSRQAALDAPGWAMQWVMWTASSTASNLTPPPHSDSGALTVPLQVRRPLLSPPGQQFWCAMQEEVLLTRV